jgi:hypothetical protein
MTQADVDEFVRKADAIYATRLRSILEPEHIDEFVVIDPESGDYFRTTASIRCLASDC